MGVVNRSQRDINVGTALASARAKESAYFASHPAYRAMAKRMGCTYLCLKLNKVWLQVATATSLALQTVAHCSHPYPIVQLLIQHAHKFMPAVKTRITNMLAETQVQAVVDLVMPLQFD